MRLPGANSVNAELATLDGMKKPAFILYGWVSGGSIDI